MHIPYQQRSDDLPYFKIKYKFYSYENRGRKILPFQGIRSAFSYNDNEFENSELDIFPEFLDDEGKVITESNIPVNEEGYVFMWILRPEMRQENH